MYCFDDMILLPPINSLEFSIYEVAWPKESEGNLFIYATTFVSRNFVADIHSKTGQILNRGTGSAQPVGGAYDVQVSLKVQILFKHCTMGWGEPGPDLYLEHCKNGIFIALLASQLYRNVT